MSKSTLNFLVDAVALAAFVPLGATGLFIRYVLPPGSGHFCQVWGMDRHQWGDVHFWLAMTFLAAATVHVLLHWRWIVGMIVGRSPQGSKTRIALALVGVAILAAVAASPFFGNVERAGEPPHKHRSEEPSAPAVPINGTMTLREVEQRTGVPAKDILSRLGLPADLPIDEPLGRLRKRHNFSMHDVQDIVRKQQEPSPSPSLP